VWAWSLIQAGIITSVEGEMSENHSGVELNPAQESNFVFNIDAESDWWPAFIWKFCVSEEEVLASLFPLMIEEPEQ
jgi:hypothetical protein